MDFRDEAIAALAQKADGLFEWARVAWEHIIDARFDALMARGPKERKYLLYDIYDLILAELMPQDQYTTAIDQRALARFRFVMGQILGAAQRLPLASLNNIRIHFPDQDDRYNVELVVRGMGPLLSGSTSLQLPI